MSALGDFAQGFFQNRAEALQRQELAKEEMSAYERKLKMQQELQEKLEATKVAKEVPDLDRGVMVMYNSKGKEIGTRPMNQAEIQSYRNTMDRESAETRRAGALATIAERDVENYDEDRASRTAAEEQQRRIAGGYLSIAQAQEARNAEQWRDDSGYNGPPRNRAGGGALGNLSPDRRLRMSTDVGGLEGEALAIIDAAAQKLTDDDPRNAQLVTDYERVLSAPPEEQARLMSQFIARYKNLFDKDY